MLYLIEIMCRNNKINNNILMLTKGVRDRLRLYAVYGEYDKAEDDSEQGEVVPVMVIEAERNKLKESTDD